MHFFPLICMQLWWRRRGSPVTPEEEWTARRSCGTSTASPQPQPPHSVDADAGSTRTGVECLPADLCRALGGVSTRPSTLSDPLLRCPRAPDARLWESYEDGLCRVSLPPLRSREAPRGDEL